MNAEKNTTRFPRDPESVAVVGAGPTGVMLAIELGRRGVTVTVLERLGEPPTEVTDLRQVDEQVELTVRVEEPR
jgi:NADPH-dependent 2,4-dienoyl-CoA reductase/sulfur reductase-like enzyme